MSDDDSAPPGARRGILGWLLLLGLVAYAAAMHHGVGPTPDGGATAWHHPTEFLWSYDFLTVPLESTRLALAALVIPALLLGLLVLATTQSAVARALATIAILASTLYVFYGVEAPFVWKFFKWRGSAVMLTTAAVVGLAWSAPWLARSWLRLGWGLRLLVYAPVLAVCVAFIRNATGTDQTLPFAISPWPAVPVFGMEVGAFFAALWMFGVALGIALIARASDGRGASARVVAGVVLAVGAPMALLRLGSEFAVFPFTAGATTLLAAGLACAVGVAIAAHLPVAAGESLSARARILATGALLVGMPLVIGQGLARVDYHISREQRAREIIDALDTYYAREDIYPDELAELVSTGDIAAIPEPSIGFGFLYDAPFAFQNFGTSYNLEFSAPRWVQCAYNPPWKDEDEWEDEELEEDGDEAEGETTEWYDTIGDEVEGESELGEAWSCPSEPPELW